MRCLRDLRAESLAIVVQRILRQSHEAIEKIACERDDELSVLRPALVCDLEGSSLPVRVCADRVRVQILRRVSVNEPDGERSCCLRKEADGEIDCVVHVFFELCLIVPFLVSLVLTYNGERLRDSKIPRVQDFDSVEVLDLRVVEGASRKQASVDKKCFLSSSDADNGFLTACRVRQFWEHIVVYRAVLPVLLVESEEAVLDEVVFVRDVERCLAVRRYECVASRLYVGCKRFACVAHIEVSDRVEIYQILSESVQVAELRRSESCEISDASFESCDRISLQAIDDVEIRSVSPDGHNLDDTLAICVREVVETNESVALLDCLLCCLLVQRVEVAELDPVRADFCDSEIIGLDNPTVSHCRIVLLYADPVICAKRIVHLAFLRVEIDASRRSVVVIDFDHRSEDPVVVLSEKL